MSFIPQTNLIIFNISKVVNIEAIRWTIRARNSYGKFYILLSIIDIIQGLLKSNKNLINPSVT